MRINNATTETDFGGDLFVSDRDRSAPGAVAPPATTNTTSKKQVINSKARDRNFQRLILLQNEGEFM